MSVAYLRVRGDDDRAFFAVELTPEQAASARFLYRMFRKCDHAPHPARVTTWAIALIPWGDVPPPAPRLRRVQ